MLSTTYRVATYRMVNLERAYTSKTAAGNMKKKNYLVPDVGMMILQSNPILITVSSPDGPRHGGIDYGTHEADARNDSYWDEE